MKKRKPEKKKKKAIKSVIAVMLVLAIILTGTYAWQSISQKALNQVDVDVNPGGRLHDDFDGRNKDIYVENFSETEPIFARIRLDEYMEIGPDEGKERDNPNREATPVIDGTDINDKDTWTTHIPAQTDCNPIHKYWAWKMGGDTVFMPTFNKNKDSLEPDLNGTYENQFNDYKKYELEETKTEDAIYDADTNSIDEGDAGIEGENFYKQRETHTAKKTLTATVMTMEEWMEQGSPAGPYWVYDTDGWAYWAEAIKPGESTGLLLDGIQLISSPGDKAYYAINAVAQFATAGDWGNAEEKTGFYQDGITDNALLLLYRAAGVTIDDIDFYVLAVDNGKMLIWAKEMLPKAMTWYPTSNQIWRDTSIRTYLNGDWLNEHATLKARAVNTTLTTRPAYNSSASTFITTTDDVFLLSEADLYGTFNCGVSTAVSNDYTYNGKKLPISEDMRKCAPCTDPDAYVEAGAKGDWYFLRSPGYNSSLISAVTASSGALNRCLYNHAFGFRPALWVTIDSESND